MSSTTKQLGALLALTLVLTGKTWAGESLTVTHNPAEVQGCTLIAPLSIAGPYLLPGGDIRGLKKQAVGLQADTLLIIDRSLVSHGVAYQCK